MLQHQIYYLTLACNLDLGNKDLCHIGYKLYGLFGMDINFVLSDMKIGQQILVFCSRYNIAISNMACDYRPRLYFVTHC